MFIDVIIPALILGKVRGGKFKNLYFMEIKAWYLFILGLILQTLPLLLQRFNLAGISGFIGQYFFYVHLVSYIMVAVCLILNIKKYRAVIFMLIGTLLNFAVIFANGGYMPVSLTALKISGFPDVSTLGSQLDYKHVAITESTNLKFLADIIPTPEFYPLHKILSVGDVFLALGVFVLINVLMTAGIAAGEPAQEVNQG